MRNPNYLTKIYSYVKIPNIKNRLSISFIYSIEPKYSNISFTLFSFLADVIGCKPKIVTSVAYEFNV